MNPQHDSFPEYIQAVVQFTFVACFSVVLPITPLIVLINHLVSMRLDAFKLCKGRRRPLAEKTGGIGVWEHLLHIVAVISILTNCWLMGFTSSQSIQIRENIGELGVFAFIVCWEHIMLLIKYILSTAISTLPKSVRDAMKKEQHELDQQRNAIMRLRRHQRDHDDNSGDYDTFTTNANRSTTLTELNRRALYNGSSLLKLASEEEATNHAAKACLDSV
jgi:Calcium-activated chloride channel